MADRQEPHSPGKECMYTWKYLIHAPHCTMHLIDFPRAPPQRLPPFQQPTNSAFATDPRPPAASLITLRRHHHRRCSRRQLLLLPYVLVQRDGPRDVHVERADDAPLGNLQRHVQQGQHLGDEL